jgi:Calcineurin-like phosphoesterase
MATLLLALLLASPTAPSPDSEVAHGCPPERAQNGEVRLVFLADSGYGEGFSDWGARGQDAIAARIKGLRLPPDMVFFLGDNVYWTGSSDLYKTRFDNMYDPVIRQCKAHVALGNHDVKGCRTVEEYEHWESCLGEMRSALLSDRKARYMRQGMEEEVAAQKAEADIAAQSSGELAAQAQAAGKANCLPGDASAYEDERPGTKTCNAEAALAHAQFGFGSVERGEPPASHRQRYYSILWPLPKVSRVGEKVDTSAGPAPKPLVDVIVLDSNTLKVDDSLFQDRKGQPREDQLQLLWLRNALSQWIPAPGETHRIWKLVVMHHPPVTPRGCACHVFGLCVGGHRDSVGLNDQLNKAFEDLEPPDLVLAGHNHFYARSHPLDRSGKVATSGTGGVRYFVTGGGGGPLFDVYGPDERIAKAVTSYHFTYVRLTASSAFFWVMDGGGKVKDSGCFDKGSNEDHPLSPDFKYDDSLPPRCAPE